MTLEQLDAICSELENTNVTSRFTGLCLTSDVGAGRGQAGGARGVTATMCAERSASACLLLTLRLTAHGCSVMALMFCSTRPQCRQRLTPLLPSPGASSPSQSRARWVKVGRMSGNAQMLGTVVPVHSPQQKACHQPCFSLICLLLKADLLAMRKTLGSMVQYFERDGDAVVVRLQVPGR